MASAFNSLYSHLCNAGGFSAACFYFARELQKTRKIPLGLVHASWGGSGIEAWMTPTALRKVGGYDDAIEVLNLSIKDGRLQFKLGDDGRGLAVAKIRQKAIDNGLIPADGNTPPEEIAQLIFASGFSTAEKVTEVSGRGVGMDAVKGFLQREGGDVAIHFTDNTVADMRPFELVITLPEKFAAHLAA